MLFLSSRIVTISQRIKMQNYALLLRGFVVLLLCDYGMVSSSTLESITTGPGFNISTSNITMTTAESTTTVTSASNGSESPSHDNTTTDTVSTMSTTHNLTLPSEDPSVMRTTDSKASNASVISGAITPKNETSGQYAAAVIILVFIIILIILLLGILYFLRKKGRSYSFDLTQTSCSANDYEEPLRDLEQQVISYEQNDKDLPVCLDYTKEDDQPWSNGPKGSPSGCAEETTEPSSDGDYVFQHAEEPNVPEENSCTSSISLTPPVRKVEFSLDLDLIGGESEPNSPTPVDACDAAQNENNNNVTHAGCGAAEEIFTEVSLDEPQDHP